MLQYPTIPHDWALWLFEKLELLEYAGNHWQGVLPKDLNFDEVVGMLPERLKGHCDPDRRTIEFHPAVVGVFESMTELVDGARRRNVLKIFTVRDLCYTHGRSTPIPEVVEQYLGAVRLWQLFDRSADHGTGQGHSLFFIKTFESKVELRCEYTATDLRTLDRLDEFSKNYFESDHHRDQKRTIIRNALLEIFKGQIVVRLSDILLKFQEFVESVRNAYTLYTTDFSFERLRLEVDKQNLEDILRLNKTFSDIQNQLLAIPAAMLLVGANVKTNNLAANFATIVGVSIFAWIMSKLIRNQFCSVEAIDEEIQLRQGKIKEQPAEISKRLMPRFSDLSDRIKHQYSVLRGIRIAAALVWIITVAIVLDTQWPELRPQLLELVCKAVSTATAWLGDVCTQIGII
jgi:membrane protein YdbS with pleckstrin-like domain